MWNVRAWSIAAWVAVSGLVITAIAGTWWTATAMQAGESISAMTRLAISGLIGAYYVLLLQATTITRRRYP